MSVLVIAEHDGVTPSTGTLSSVTAAASFGSPVDVLVAGASGTIADSLAAVAGLARVRAAIDSRYEHPLAEDMADLVTSVAGGYSHIVAPASTFGKNFMPRVAALLDVGQISEIISVVSDDTFVRRVYTGNVLATVQSSDAIKVITVCASAFDAAADRGGNASVEALELPAGQELSWFVSQVLSTSERPKLTTSRVVVAGGRGVGSSENFKLVGRLADCLDAAVGATRAAVDSEWVSNEYQIGQTGKIVAPELYIGLGISGAIQHMAGMTGSKVVVAINKDEEAPIFEVADYRLVADLSEALPELIARLGG